MSQTGIEPSPSAMSPRLLSVAFVATYLLMFLFRYASPVATSCVSLVPLAPSLIGPVPYTVPLPESCLGPMWHKMVLGLGEARKWLCLVSLYLLISIQLLIYAELVFSLVSIFIGPSILYSGDIF